MYKVTWIDSNVYSGWHEVGSEEYKTLVITTVGFIIEDTGSHLAIAQSSSEHGHISEVMVVPTRCVIKKEPLNAG